MASERLSRVKGFVWWAAFFADEYTLIMLQVLDLRSDAPISAHQSPARHARSGRRFHRSHPTGAHDLRAGRPPQLRPRAGGPEERVPGPGPATYPLVRWLFVAVKWHVGCTQIGEEPKKAAAPVGQQRLRVEFS